MKVAMATYGFYIQGGPAIVMPDGVDAKLSLLASSVAAVAVSDGESFCIYGELSFMTGDEQLSIGTKIGAKWTF